MIRFIRAEQGLIMRFSRVYKVHKIFGFHRSYGVYTGVRGFIGVMEVISVTLEGRGTSQADSY